MSLLWTLLACVAPEPMVAGPTGSTPSTPTDTGSPAVDTAPTDTPSTPSDTGADSGAPAIEPVLVQPNAMLTFDWCALSSGGQLSATVLRMTPGAGAAEIATMLAAVDAGTQSQLPWNIDGGFPYGGTSCVVTGTEFDDLVGGSPGLDAAEVLAGRWYLVVLGDETPAFLGWQAFYADPASTNTEVTLQPW